MPSAVKIANAKVARAARAKDNAAYTAARTELATERIDAYVRQILADAPPLSDEQRTRLAELMRPVKGAGAA